jgi:hypothetical protein
MRTKLLLTGIAALFLATETAHAQRCPAGQDAFLNCLPTDQRYGQPGQIPTPQLQHAQRHGRAARPCVYDYVMGLRRRGDPRARRIEAAGAATPGNRNFDAVVAEAERRCSRSRR